MGVTLTMTVSGNNNTSTTGPSPSEQKSFQNEIKNKSTEDIAKLATDSTQPPWKQQEAMKEILKRAMEMLKDPESDMDDKEKSGLEELLKALSKPNKGESGKAETGELMAKLLEHMGVPSDVAKGIGEMLSKGDGSI